jgi:hypothetical protein
MFLDNVKQKSDLVKPELIAIVPKPKPVWIDCVLKVHYSRTAEQAEQAEGSRAGRASQRAAAT